MPRSRMLELYLRSSVRHHGVVLNGAEGDYLFAFTPILKQFGNLEMEET
jgi:hypothetical protein